MGMGILRRVLKFTPAVAIGLLLTAWVLSAFGVSCVKGSIGEHGGVLLLVPGALSFCVVEGPLFFEGDIQFSGHSRFEVSDMLGYTSFYVNRPLSNARLSMRVPFSLIITGLLPLAIGPFISFRFRLWHYLAYTALVALEFAYYFHWHE